MSNRLFTLIMLALVMVCAIYGGIRVSRSNTTAASTPEGEPVCGHHCVYRACQLLGAPVSLDEIMRRMPAVEGAHSLLDLLTELTAIGFKCEGRQENLKSLQPAGASGRVYIAALARPDHFIVIHSIDDRGVHIFDNVGRRSLLSPDQFESRWTGAVLLIERESSSPLPAYERTPPASPRLQADKLCYDMGSIQHSRGPVAFRYTINNLGTAELTIHDVHRSCRCVELNLSRSRLAPGESATLDVSYSAALERGAFSQELALLSNDPLHPVVTLTAAGFLYSGVWSLTPGVDFGKVSVGEHHRRYLYLAHSDRIEDFRILSVKSTVPEMAVRECTQGEAIQGCEVTQSFLREKLTLDTSTTPYRILEINFTPPVNSRPTEIDGEIVVQTNVEKHEEMRFTVTAKTQLPIQCYPPSVAFGPKVKTAQTVELSRPDGKDFEIVSVESGNIRCEQSSRFSKGGTLVLRFAPPAADSPSRQDVRFKIRSGESSFEITVPVYRWSS